MKYRKLVAMGMSAWLAVSGIGPGYVALAENVAEAVSETVTEAAKPAEIPTEAPKPAEAATEAPKPTEAVTEAPTSAETPAESQKPSETPAEAVTETSSELITDAPGTETPSETVPDGSQGETSAEGNMSETEATGAETEAGMSETVLTESEKVTEKEKDKDGLIEADTESEKEESHLMTNEQLIARQNIVIPPDISLEFRFVQVEKVYAVVKNLKGARIQEEKSESSAVVGKIDYEGLCYILEDEDDEWVYVESGEVRGFISAEDITVGDTADKLVSDRGEETLPLAVSTMLYSENDAYDYTHTTVYPTVVQKVYGIAEKNINIYEAKRENARVTGTLEEGGLCYILADAGEEWVYVESGDVRGFVQAEELCTGPEAIQKVTENGEMNLHLASLILDPEENKACYYTLTSVRVASQGARIRSDMVNFSFQFLGNPYVWGGTSLTDGCDCSGFTQSIYAHFGYYIPRVAEAQAVYGMQIPVSAAAPGDLIFYAKNGYVYHVSMYIGNGQVIHAAGTNQGIIISGIGSAAVWATRVI